MTNRLYLTTALPYVNAAPHLGHALELVQADVLARHHRLRGAEVRLFTGTDDNAAKNVTAAAAAGQPVAEFVAENAARFTALAAPLDIAVDVHAATSSARHREVVQRLWRACAADLYAGEYTGRYCPGCEAFVAESSCAEHGTTTEVSERNWFFRLSRYQDQIRDALESGRVRVLPEARRAEVLAFVHSGLADFSASRPAARSDGWGVPVPGDPDQVVYVWWDALTAYLDPRWWYDATRIHLVGKGILRFHAVHWLGLLLSAGEPLPDAVYVHDYVTVNGAKVSKSAGPSLDPLDLVTTYGVDALRWWVIREVTPVGDTDFTTERLITRADHELANGIGNLVARTLGLLDGYRPRTVENPLGLGDLPKTIDDAVDRFDLRAAGGALVAAAETANRFVAERQPWRLAGAERAAVLDIAHSACRLIGTELAPFLPSGAARIETALDSVHTGHRPAPLFPRLR
ncbi:methionine--tRNA ligase [Labedaea rhizosphaerae]|uniref:methionine--tRNA ligase n=1 Tax=Labedaea rhizosphaerae TaxID=598644 RepID=A0A4R6SGX0_LABRH|nr:methionine--tRNA ligase [Labedaea rhizosphaerae]TDQ01015.1 methionyl-tRNA synthetase [Labedaea rhizosphaerae]